MKHLMLMCLIAGVFAATAYSIEYTVEFGETNAASAGVTVGANWGEAEPFPAPHGNYGGFGTGLDNYVSPTTATADHECRMVWGNSASGDASDYADVTFPLAINSVTIRHLDGLSTDSFMVLVGDGSDDGWALWGIYTAPAAGKLNSEQWFETTFTGTPGMVLRIDCTATAGTYWAEYGQLAIDRLSASAACPFSYSVDFGDVDTVSAGVIVGADWGDAEPSNSGGNYGGFGYEPQDDLYEAPATATADYQCRVVWGNQASGDDDQATVTFPLDISSVTIRHLNGYSDDSFNVYVDDVLWGSYDATAAVKTSDEQWFETTFTGTPGTVLTIVCTGEQGSVYWPLYGQLAIDRLWVCAEKCPYSLIGNLNCDCKVDLSDFAILAQSWLINCAEDPSNPACVNCDDNPSDPACCGCSK